MPLKPPTLVHKGIPMKGLQPFIPQDKLHDDAMKN